MPTTHDPLARVTTAGEERKSSRRRLVGTVAASGLLVAGLRLPTAQPAAAQVFTAAALRRFSNRSTISIVDRTADRSAAVPYPSVINVSGMPGRVISVRVTLHGLTHERVKDVQVALVSPTGIATWLMGSVGNDIFAPNSFTLGFDDNASGNLPQAPFNSGTYKPTKYPPSLDTAFPPPAPQPVSAVSLGVFRGLRGRSLNGDWKLCVVDSLTGGAGSIAGGWTLRIRTTNSRPIAGNDIYVVEPGEQLIVKRPGILQNDSDPDGDRLRVKPFSQKSRLGRIVVRADGSFRFSAHPRRTGIVRFDYTVRDPRGLTDTGRIRIRVRHRS